MMNGAPSYLVGVDGGGSNCRIAIANTDGRMLGKACGAAANPTTSLPGAVRAILDTLKMAQDNAGIDDADIATAHAHFGLAGAISDDIATQVAKAMPFADIHVTDDRATTMAGALGKNDGYVAAVGTGSFVGSKSGHQKTFVGGWGFELGDEASGAWLGRQLLATVLRQLDGMRAASKLLSETLNGFQNDTGAIVRFAKRATPSDFAEFAPKIVDAAHAGDAAGKEIMRRGADYLQAALETLNFQAGDPLCLSGGLGPQYQAYLRPDFTQNIVSPHASALEGALALAADMASRARTDKP